MRGQYRTDGAIKRNGGVCGGLFFYYQRYLGEVVYGNIQGGKDRSDRDILFVLHVFVIIWF